MTPRKKIASSFLTAFFFRSICAVGLFSALIFMDCRRLLLTLSDGQSQLSFDEPLGHSQTRQRFRGIVQSDDASAFRYSSENYLIKVKRSFGLLIARRQGRMTAPQKGESFQCWRQHQIVTRDNAERETVRPSGYRCWLPLPPRCH